MTEPFRKCQYVFRMRCPAACSKADFPKLFRVPAEFASQEAAAIASPDSRCQPILLCLDASCLPESSGRRAVHELPARYF